VSETSIPIQELEDEEESTADTIWETIEANHRAMAPFIEETIDRWNSRT